VGGSPCARRTRTMKQCSSDARTMGHPTHSPFEFTATRLGGEREALRWTRAVWPNPATYPKRTTGHQRESGKKSPLSWMREPTNFEVSDSDLRIRNA
jgi:hypothetical protein